MNDDYVRIRVMTLQEWFDTEPHIGHASSEIFMNMTSGNESTVEHINGWVKPRSDKWPDSNWEGANSFDLAQAHCGPFPPLQTDLNVKTCLLQC
jgi:hypothetical protein